MKRVFVPVAGMAMCLVALAPVPALAYVGPGAGISLLGALWALVAVIGSALLYVVLWPLRRLHRRRRQSAAAVPPAPAEGDGASATDAGNRKDAD